MRSRAAFRRSIGLLATVALACVVASAPTVQAAPVSVGAKGKTLLVYPGSFDIFHTTHLAELKSALSQVRGERGNAGASALVLPNHDRPIHLPEGRTRYIFDARQRVSLARAATKGAGNISVRHAFRNGTPTVTQLLRVARESRGQRVAVLVGEDAFRGLRKWKGFRQLLGALDFYVSVAPARLKKLPPPKALLGAAGKRYTPTGDHGYEDARTGQRIRYLGIAVPDVHSHAILKKLASRLPLSTRELPAPELRELSRPRYKKTLRRLTHAQLSPERGRPLPRRAARPHSTAMRQRIKASAHRRHR